MTFVYIAPKYSNGDSGTWWKWNVEKHRLENYHSGYIYIDENSEWWATATMKELDSWHELYKATGFNPLEQDKYAFDVWISPEGKFFEGDAHSVAAEYIVDLVYGIDIDDPCFTGSAENYLDEHHWIKATRSFMWNLYLEHRKEWKMTPATYGALVQYCEADSRRILPIPKGVQIIRT